jgi:hypothetical protein
MQNTQHIYFKSIKTRLLGSDGKLVQLFETMRVDLQYMLFLLEGSLAIFDVLVGRNRFGLEYVLEAVQACENRHAIYLHFFEARKKAVDVAILALRGYFGNCAG